MLFCSFFTKTNSNCLISDAGDLFGWGNSEYNQLAVVTDHTQVNNPRHLKVNCGRVVQAAAGGATCALINGELSDAGV